MKKLKRNTDRSMRIYNILTMVQVLLLGLAVLTLSIALAGDVIEYRVVDDKEIPIVDIGYLSTDTILYIDIEEWFNKYPYIIMRNESGETIYINLKSK